MLQAGFWFVVVEGKADHQVAAARLAATLA
jgi:hypothetical protein